MPNIKKINDNIVTLDGKFLYKQEQVFTLSKEAKGIVISASENEAQLLVIGNPSSIKTKDVVKVSSEKINQIEVADGYFGSIISPWREILHPLNKSVGKIIGSSILDQTPPDLLDRIKLSKPLSTGILAIDTIIPIGLGQRELIIGDRSTGKSTIAINSIINQKNTNVKTIYVAVGQKRSSIISTYETLKKYGVDNKTIIIFANPDSPAEQYLAPKIGMAMAEAIAYKGDDVLIVIDDLSKHANIYREISLSIGKNPGREAYPTDIFYQHARLLERAGKFNDKYKNGSITCLPIVETIQGDLASSIPSNVISITDGQIFTTTELFNKSIFPAINIGLSVSRTGSAVQSKRIKNISKDLKATYAELFDIKKFADMSIDLSTDLQEKIKNWQGINNLLIQFGNEGYSEMQIEIMIKLFKLKTLSDIKDANNFSIAFRNFCKNDVGAKKLINELKNGSFEDEGKFIKALEAVFIPLIRIASGVKDDIVTKDEYNKYKGGM